MRKRLSIFADLFLSFFKIGLFTFGGGYAMISMIQHTCVEQKGWITHDEMMDVTVIAESTPGPVAINCATYVGCKKAGFAGAAVATAGIVFPSFIIIYIISCFLDRFLEYTVIANGFQGIRIGVGLLILRVGLDMVTKMPSKAFPRIITGGAFAAMLLIHLFSWHFSSIGLMMIAGGISLVLFYLKRGEERG